MKHKLLKKIIGIFGYKLIEKNFIKNERLISSKSFLKIDKLLEVMFDEKKINNLIQVGANDGKRFDILNFFIKKYKCKSLLVEPIKEYFDQLIEHYKNCDFIEFENSAISVDGNINKIFKVNPKHLSKYGDHIPGISSFEKEHLIKHGVKKNHIINVPVSSISMIDLLKKFNIQSLDLLYIDAEGYDANIVIDFLKTTSIRPIIILEYIHVEKNIFEKMTNILEKENYTLFAINENLLCYPKKDKQFIKFN